MPLIKLQNQGLASGVGGKILNVYQVRTGTSVNVTQTSYQDIGLSQAVTPSSSSSK